MSIQQKYFEELRKFEGAPYVWGGALLQAEATALALYAPL